jgi:hypothetical protein
VKDKKKIDKTQLIVTVLCTVIAMCVWYNTNFSSFDFVMIGISDIFKATTSGLGEVLSDVGRN